MSVILARAVPVGVIFRRGPDKWVQIIRWDTATDTFTPGQWFHGRIYENRCDLSPDGTFLVYFAQKLTGRTLIDNDYTYAWTAISKLPYLTALALWPKGNCWDGGGLFLAERQLWLNHPPQRMTPHENHRPPKWKITANARRFGEDEPIFSRRLPRDGGRLSEVGPRPDTAFALGASRIWRKQNPHGWQKLTMFRTLVGSRDRYDYSVRIAEGQDWILENAAWADWDRNGRLLFARAGKLFATDAHAGTMGAARELADFNAAKHTPMEAPPWAKEW